MAKIVINKTFGGFDLSEAGQARLFQLGSEHVKKLPPEVRTEWHSAGDYLFRSWDIPRHDPLLIQVVEELGEAANGDNAELEIVEIVGNLYRIREEDGREFVETPDFARWIDASALAAPVAWSF